MSNTLQQLKDKQLQEFNENFVATGADIEGMKRVEYRQLREHQVEDLKSFLTHSIELAYEEGRKEKSKKIAENIGCDECWENLGSESLGIVKFGCSDPDCKCECHQPPENNDWVEKLINKIYQSIEGNLDSQDSFEEDTKDDLRNLLLSHRTSLIQEIRGKVEYMKKEILDPGGYKMREEQVDDALKYGFNEAINKFNDLLKELK